MGERRFLLGNEAIARGIVEAGCEVASAYPGTPSSEILPAIAKFADELNTKTVVEWGVNEKVSFEVAAVASFAGKRSVAVMKQVGLNVAADPLMSVAHFDIKGGFLVVVADDPGPYSSQTEQDSRFMAMFAKIPCFDPSSAKEAKEMVFDAFDLSEKFMIPVMLRPTGRVCHSRQDVEVKEPIGIKRPADFEKDWRRWVCLPAHVRINHPKLNRKRKEICNYFETLDKYNYEVPAKSGKALLGIIASGVSFSVVMDLIEKNNWDDIAVLKIGTPHPLPIKLVQNFIDKHERVLILEETYPVIEMQIHDRTKVMGRWNGFVPEAGELLPEKIEGIVKKALGKAEETETKDHLLDAIKDLNITPKKPVLCPGCPHRASFFAIKKASPRSVVPSDIGCYTLGVNQGAVDIVICMGGAVTAGSGLFNAYKVDGKEIPVVSTIGDSTFFHMGIPGLVSAVYNKHAFVLAILDNLTTAMTGNQPTPETGYKLRKNDVGRQISLESVVKGCGVNFVKVVDAYDVSSGIEAIKEASEYAAKNQLPAVVIFRHPCMLIKDRDKIVRYPVSVNQQKCTGCRYCITSFFCPGLVFDEDKKKAYIDERFCVGCGVCEIVCPVKAIEVERG